jgi:hypothetical protein
VVEVDIDPYRLLLRASKCPTTIYHM